MDKIAQLRALLREHNLRGYIISTADEWNNEYPPECSRRLQWLTGFSGSYGMAVVHERMLLFITDGRYLLQTQLELGDKWHIFDLQEEEAYKKALMQLNGKIAFDPMLFSIQQQDKLAKIINELTPLQQNLIDELWEDKPSMPNTAVQILPIEHCGATHQQKLTELVEKLHKEADCLMLTAPESICWLFNIRAKDVPYCPILLCYALIWRDGTIELFCDNTHLPNELSALSQPLAQLKSRYEALVAAGKKIQLDIGRTSYWFKMANNNFINADDPCEMPKACKNSVELKGMRDSHLQDGVAVTKFLYWLDKNYTRQEIDELSAAAKLLEFRHQRPLFQGESFATISGFEANGAIIHYHSTSATNKRLQVNGLYLLDSGGQYLNGTTDITRTIPIGTPSEEQRWHFTLVLKGHIALARAIFPEGTNGGQLDALARAALWREGLDYAHGTGHGVGYFLNVHEGPQRIARYAVGNKHELKVGMILSNEPGYYKTGHYGIRIENLMEVITAKKSGFLQFATLTVAPIDCRLILPELLHADELQWLYNYHKQIKIRLKAHLSAEEDAWLNKITAL